MILLTLTIGIGLPLVAFACIVLTPFSDRLARIQMALTYLFYVAATVHLAGVVA